MLNKEQVTISKEQLLSNYFRMKEWLTQYWYFLEELPLDAFADNEEVVDHLRQQHQSLISTKIKLQTLDMAGLVLAFALDRINPKQLIFQIPKEKHPEEFQKIMDLSLSARQIELSLQRIVEQIMYLSRHLLADEEKFSPLLQAIGSFFKAIIRHDGDDMKIQLSQINLLSTTKESHLLVQEVGKITRDIYDSLQYFSQDLDVNTEEIQHVTEEMPDAVQKINSVIARLEEAANDNLEFLETLLQQSEGNIAVLEELMTHITTMSEMLDTLGEKHSELSEDLAPMKDLIQNGMMAKAETLMTTFQENENLFLTIMTNQGFQDLTGQTLKKIVDFIEHLELRLLELIQKFSENLPEETKPETTTPPADVMTRIDHGVEEEDIALHGPDESEGQKSTQGDVDSLLAEMGF